MLTLIDVLKLYTNKTDADFQQVSDNRWITLCHAHDDHSPSLSIYDKPEGWDFFCYACGAAGNMYTLLVDLGICKNTAEANERITKDFNLMLPENVNFINFCAIKKISPSVARKWGLEDHKTGLLFPYYKDGKIATQKIRTKYKGDSKFYYLDKAKALPFGLQFLSDYPDDVLYIAEGESDTLTLSMCGLPAIGIPGTNAWKPEYMSYIKTFKRIVICKDNDAAGATLVNVMKGDRVFVKQPHSKYKDVNDLYVLGANGSIDAFLKQFRALPEYPTTISSYLSLVQKNTDIVKDPLAIQYLKQDLTHPLTVADFLTQMAKLTGYAKRDLRSYLRLTLPQDEKAVPSRLSVVNGGYAKVLTIGDTQTVRQISNFTIEPIYEINTEDSLQRYIRLISNSEINKEVCITPEDMCNLQKFQACMLSAGNFLFSGSQQDLQEVNALIIGSETPRILSPPYIGQLPDGCWLFGNGGLDTDKSWQPTSKDGFVPLNGKLYSPRSINIEGGDSDLPLFHNTSPFPPADMTHISETLLRSFGTLGTWLGLGWLAAGWHSAAICKRFGFYPHLFISGKRGSGKSTLAQTLYSAFGFQAGEGGLSIETPSNVGILRCLTHRSSLPQWYDDYRNNVKRIQAKDGLLIDTYNRHGSVKGVAHSYGIRAENLRGFLLLSGEDTPSNNALLSRCCTITVSEYERNDALLAVLQNLNMTGLGFHLAKQPLNLDLIESLAKHIHSDSRYALNHAIFASAFMQNWGHSDAFLKWLSGCAKHEKTDIDSEHPVVSFILDFNHMLQLGYVKENIDYIIDGNNLYIRLRQAHHLWSSYCRSHGLAQPIQCKTLRDYIVKEPYCRDPDARVHIGNASVRAVHIDIHELNSLYDCFHHVPKEY